MSDPLVRLTFVSHLAATLYMVGVIWFVQLVHYPLFARVGAGEFPGYEKSHADRTTLVVAPPMLLEAVTAILLFAIRPSGIPIWQLAVGLALLVVIWASTMFLQVPCHSRLIEEFEPAIHSRLVATNWIRTVAWTARGAIALQMTTGLLR